MPRVPLLAGAYQSRSIISGAQRCINLYPERNDDPQAPVPVTHFPTPGLTLRGTPPAPGPARCSYRAKSNGKLYEVVGGNVYLVSNVFGYTKLGEVPNLVTPVSMSDNGLVAVLVDGTATGYVIDLTTNQFATITAANFLGGTRVDYLDTVFCFNAPNSTEWYISLALVTYDNLANNVITAPALYAAFDPLDIAAKTGSSDQLATLIVMHRVVWLLGVLTTEVWQNTGAADFAYSSIPGVFVQFGCGAPYSVATQDLSIFWLAQDAYGKAIILRGNADYSVTELSSKGIEAILQAMPVISDAIGGCFQQNGHAFYVITFPTANRTFAVELKTEQWHELAYSGANGLERHRANCWCFNFGMNLIGDYQNGKLYQLDSMAFTDAGNPITRLRTVPHLLNDGKRIRLDWVAADTQGGTQPGTNDGPWTEALFSLLSENNLLTGLKLCLDSGDQASWPGVNQTWFDRSGGGYNFFLGLDGVAAGDDPMFAGAIGGLGLADCWAFDGGDIFTLAQANPAWVNNLSKANAKWTAFFLIYSGDASANQLMLATIADGGIDTGLYIAFNANSLYFAVSNAGVSVLAHTAAGAIASNRWHIVGVSVDAAAGTGHFSIDGVVTDFAAVYVNPSAGAASHTLTLAGGAGGTVQLPNGSRLISTLMWDVALTPAQMAEVYSLMKTREDLPSPLTAQPPIFLRVSYNRGGSFGEAVPGEFGSTGEYGEFPSWRNLGMARDFVLELSWSAPINTALNGIFYDATPAKT